MGRLENRLRRLEEEADKIGFPAAIQRLDDDEFPVFFAYMERWEAEGGESTRSPHPTPGEAVVLRKLHEHRRQAVREGWGNSAYRAY